MPITVEFPDFRLGRGTPKQFLARDIRASSIPSAFRQKALDELFTMWRDLPPEIRCQTADTDRYEQEQIENTRGTRALGDWSMTKLLRLTEQDCKGDITPVTYVVVDTQNDNRPVAGWQWYNIRFTAPPTQTTAQIRMRPWPIFPLNLNLTPRTIARWSVDVLDLFLSNTSVIEGRTTSVTQIRTYTALGFGTRWDAMLSAYRDEIDARGADPNNPLMVSVLQTPWGGEDRHLTWEP